MHGFFFFKNKEFFPLDEDFFGCNWRVFSKVEMVAQIIEIIVWKLVVRYNLGAYKLRAFILSIVS